jgi:hypothetical protein
LFHEVAQRRVTMINLMGDGMKATITEGMMWIITRGGKKKITIAGDVMMTITAGGVMMAAMSGETTTISRSSLATQGGETGRSMTDLARPPTCAKPSNKIAPRGAGGLETYARNSIVVDVQVQSALAHRFSLKSSSKISSRLAT